MIGFIIIAVISIAALVSSIHEYSDDVISWDD